MSEREMYVTSEGYKALEEELTFLRGARRQEVARRLHDALGEGELIENAELEDARREQSFVEGRIITLEEQLRNAVIIDEQKRPKGVVVIGSTVTVQEDGAATQESYFVVGSAEADPRNGKISNESPIGKAVIGHKAGETLQVEAPGGHFKVKIVKVK